jgi:hypothetical protein
MKRLIVAVLLLVSSTAANATVYLCQSSSMNGSEPRHQISSVYIENGVRIQTRGEIKEITGQYYSLEKADDRFILKRYNHNLLVDSKIAYTEVLSECTMI